MLLAVAAVAAVALIIVMLDEPPSIGTTFPGFTSGKDSVIVDPMPDQSTSEIVEQMPTFSFVHGSNLESLPTNNRTLDDVFVTSKGDLKKVGLPTTGKIRFVPGKKGLIGNSENGYIDKFGNKWVKGNTRTSGEAYEWDVQLSNTGRSQLGWATRDGSHLNVSLKGRITHK